MFPHRHRARLAAPALLLCAAGLAVGPAAQAFAASHAAPHTAPHRAPGDVTLTGGSFGTVQVGESGTVTLTLTNNGTEAVGFDGVPVSLPPGVTRTGGSCDLDAALLVGESCTLVLTWTPTAEGPYTGTVSLTVDEDPFPPYQVSAEVTGNAVAAPGPSPSPTATGPTSSPSASPSASPSKPSELAHTGSETTRTVVLSSAAFALVAGGLALALWGRRHRA